jgi:hypothetical protein
MFNKAIPELLKTSLYLFVKTVMSIFMNLKYVSFLIHYSKLNFFMDTAKFISLYLFLVQEL